MCAYLSVMQIDLKAKRGIKHGAYSRAMVLPQNFIKDDNSSPQKRNDKDVNIVNSPMKSDLNESVENLNKQMNFMNSNKKKKKSRKHSKAIVNNNDGFNFDDEDSSEFGKLPPIVSKGKLALKNRNLGKIGRNKHRMSKTKI